uniref:Uncharacterized protein n=1 Tax=Rhizophora mucronata TaxID=61149 RepID=A0A2P2QHM2_RHIMU
MQFHWELAPYQTKNNQSIP